MAMNKPTAKPKQILFVDDDAAFLAQVRELFGALSRGTWEIHLAQNHAQALALLPQRRMDLVVIDLGMPVVDGVQFLRLLNRAHPGQQTVVLTGLAAEEKRRECTQLGALLFLEKPTAPGGYEAIYAALDALAGTNASTTGFRGMMRSLGLEEVLQMECLGAKSSILEIFTGRARGRIYICDGVIIHAEKDNLLGEVALYSLLALRGGEFNLLPFVEPTQRTIQGQWEFLLMEAARLRDEGGEPPAEPEPELEPLAALVPEPALVLPTIAPAPPALKPVVEPTGSAELRIEEFLLCSGAGEVLHDWQCQSPEARLALLQELEGQAAQIAGAVPVGRFERAEIFTAKERLLGLVQSDRRLFLRNTGGVA